MRNLIFVAQVIEVSNQAPADTNIFAFTKYFTSLGISAMVQIVAFPYDGLSQVLGGAESILLADQVRRHRSNHENALIEIVSEQTLPRQNQNCLASLGRVLCFVTVDDIRDSSVFPIVQSKHILQVSKLVAIPPHLIPKHGVAMSRCAC